MPSTPNESKPSQYKSTNAQRNVHTNNTKKGINKGQSQVPANKSSVLK